MCNSFFGMFNCFGLTSYHMGKYGWGELVLRDVLLVLLFVCACTTNINFDLLFLCSNLFSPLVHFCVYEAKLDNIHTLVNQENVNWGGSYFVKSLGRVRTEDTTVSPCALCSSWSCCRMLHSWNTCDVWPYAVDGVRNPLSISILNMIKPNVLDKSKVEILIISAWILMDHFV